MTSHPPLPHLYLVTPEPDNGPAEFLRQLEASLLHGIRLVQFRAKTIDAATYRALAVDVLACCRQYDALLLLNAEPRLMDTIDADGLHLDSVRLAACDTRPAVPDRKLVSAACHSLEQVRLAEAITADFLTLSPVLPTASHPGAATLGWDKFSVLAKQTEIPVYALGGMHENLRTHARVHGAYGLAGIQAFWQR